MIKNIIKTLDLFSIPFQFHLSDNQKVKKTLFGGLVSLIVICLSLAYLAYLSNLFFGNKIMPNISLNNVYLSENMEFNIYENTIAFQMQLANGLHIEDIQKNGKIYIQVYAVFTKTDLNGQDSNIFLPMKPCEDISLIGYLCFDFQSFNEGKNYISLKYYPGQLEKEKLQIIFQYCSKEKLLQGQTCATRQETREKILKITSQVFIKIQTLQYSPSKRVYEIKAKQEKYYFSEGLVQFSKLLMSKTTSRISQGFIIQTTKEESYLSDYKRIDVLNTNEYLKTELGLDLIAVCQIFINDYGVEQDIQYSQFTYILAQFTSVFNSLLVLGILCKQSAQSELVQDFVELQLKVYYKRTAYDIITNFDQQKANKFNSLQPKLNLFNLYQRIQSIKFDNLKILVFNISLYQKQILYLNFNNFKKNYIIFAYKIRIKQKICNCFKKKKNISSESLEQKTYIDLIKKSNEQINIFELQKELIKIKMILRMLLTVEQYAAIQLCGTNINFKNQDYQDNQVEKTNIQLKEQPFLLKEDGDFKIISVRSQLNTKNSIVLNEKNITKLQSHDKLNQNKQELESVLSQSQNHLDKIDQLERDQTYFQKCLDRYFVKNTFSTELDQRIIGSMIGSDEMKLNYIKNIQTDFQPLSYQ